MTKFTQCVALHCTALMLSTVTREATPVLPYKHPHMKLNSEAAASLVECMGERVESHPAFAELYSGAGSKHALIGQLKPYLWVGAGAGVGSSFCSGVSSQYWTWGCSARQCLQALFGIWNDRYMQILHYSACSG